MPPAPAPGSETGPSVLWRTPPASDERPPAPDCFADLQLDALVATITAGRDEYRLRPFFHTLLPDPDAVAYRHEVFQDLEDDDRRAGVLAFARAMRRVRGLQAQGAGLTEPLQRERLFLDAAVDYVAAVDQLAADLARRPPASPLPPRPGIRTPPTPQTPSAAHRPLRSPRRPAPRPHRRRGPRGEPPGGADPEPSRETAPRGLRRAGGLRPP